MNLYLTVDYMDFLKFVVFQIYLHGNMGYPLGPVRGVIPQRKIKRRCHRKGV